ncbi:hypothetical protein GCM10020219_050770 [Nonomuraea dietziae]
MRELAIRLSERNSDLARELPRVSTRHLRSLFSSAAETRAAGYAANSLLQVDPARAPVEPNQRAAPGREALAELRA